VLVVLLLARRFWDEPPVSTPSQPPVAGSHDVVRVVDGDTVLFAPNMRVRLIGVNAPESVKPESPIEPWGPEASQFTREFLAGGIAQLEFDRERYDQYDRSLAYVWVGDRMLNEELLRAGLARWERHYNYSSDKKARFRAAQEEARQAGRGIWSTSMDGKKSSSLGAQSARFLALLPDRVY
jgi:micrococcal nuclease